MADHPARRNIAETLSEVLPQAHIALDAAPGSDRVLHLAVPKGHELKEIDLERLLPTPRRTKFLTALHDVESFTAYVTRHAGAATVVWCDFNPVTYALKFTAVIDEIGPRNAAAWRQHMATHTPALSHEWSVWTGSDGGGKARSQMDFAEFLERNESDITAQDGTPSSLQMMQMATEFEATSDKRFKSIVRLQGGGVRFDYVDDDNATTIAQMKVFERFAIGVPVFRGGAAYRLDARLKYRHSSGKVTFWFELIRPDRVHEAAARELIERVRTGIAGVPLLMGAS